MARAFDWGFAAGFGPVMLRGSDVPDLPAAVVAEAREVLAAGRAQVVLGPATDGGYHLVGLTEPQPRLFQGPAWSSSTVLADTLELARHLGLRVHLLPPGPTSTRVTTYEGSSTRPARRRSRGGAAVNRLGDCSGCRVPAESSRWDNPDVSRPGPARPRGRPRRSSGYRACRARRFMAATGRPMMMNRGRWAMITPSGLAFENSCRDPPAWASKAG